MKKLIVASLAFLSFFSPVKAIEDARPEPKRFTVQNDGGGIVNDFKAALSYFKKTSAALSIEGFCASACTLVLSQDYSLDVCVKKNVRFGFHKPYAMDPLGVPANQIPFIYRSEQMWKEEFYNKYPEWVQKAIEARGGVPAVIQGDKANDVLWLSYTDVKPFVKTCLGGSND